jgi:hypothetical protein
LSGKKIDLISLLGHLMVSSAPTKQEKDLETTRSLLLEYDDLNTNLMDLHSRLIYCTRTVKEIKEALLEYSIPIEIVKTDSIDPVSTRNNSHITTPIDQFTDDIKDNDEDNDDQSSTVLEGDTEVSLNIIFIMLST